MCQSVLQLVKKDTEQSPARKYVCVSVCLSVCATALLSVTYSVDAADNESALHGWQSYATQSSYLKSALAQTVLAFICVNNHYVHVGHV